MPRHWVQGIVRLPCSGHGTCVRRYDRSYDPVYVSSGHPGVLKVEVALFGHGGTGVFDDLLGRSCFAGEEVDDGHGDGLCRPHDGLVVVDNAVVVAVSRAGAAPRCTDG